MRNMTRSMCVAAGTAALCAAVAIGPLLAQGRGGGGPRTKVDHKARQNRPIELGTSGGNATDIANGFCCSGTLGSLVYDADGRQYILSNSHVFAHDVSGPDVAETGDPVNQAGLIDSQCVASAADTVANLSTLSSLAQGGISAVDASIAEVVPGNVRADGAILEIGTISSTPVDPALGVRVKKSARTTGLTTSRIDAINATIQVGYSTECGGASYSSSFVGQIVVANRGSRFLAGGDSGALWWRTSRTTPVQSACSLPGVPLLASRTRSVTCSRTSTWRWSARLAAWRRRYRRAYRSRRRREPWPRRCRAFGARHDFVIWRLRAHADNRTLTYSVYHLCASAITRRSAYTLESESAKNAKRARTAVAESSS